MPRYCAHTYMNIAQSWNLRRGILVPANLFWNFWEKYLFGIGSTIWAFWLVGRVDCPAIWTFNSHHFTEMLVYYLHFPFLKLFFAFHFRGRVCEPKCCNCDSHEHDCKNRNYLQCQCACHFSNTSNNNDCFKQMRTCTRFPNSYVSTSRRLSLYEL